MRHDEVGAYVRMPDGRFFHWKALPDVVALLCSKPLPVVDTPVPVAKAA